jgi:Fur family peroxide stress response transcriptional regulator
MIPNLKTKKQELGKKMSLMETHSAKEILIKAEISPSIHRVKILEYLFESEYHLTAQKIYSDLFSDIPTLSKTTIYNTLNLFKKHDIVKELNIEGLEALYDVVTEPHAHFKCKVCGQIYDIEHDCSMLKKGVVEGNHIEMCQVNFIGTCRSCLSEKNEKK